MRAQSQKPPTPHILAFDILIPGSGQSRGRAEVCKKCLQALPILSSHRFSLACLIVLARFFFALVYSNRKSGKLTGYFALVKSSESE